MLSIKRFLAVITHNEKDRINKSRIIMLFYFLFAHLILGVILTLAYLYVGQYLKLIRAILVMLLPVTLLMVLYYYKSWRIISHVTAIFLTILGAWANLLLYVGGVNTASLQYIWLTSAFSFFMLGSRWGWFYAIINITPVFLDAGLYNSEYYSALDKGNHVVRPVYVFVLAFDFALISYLHYYFFKAFSKNIVEITKVKHKLKQSNQELVKTVDAVESLSQSRLQFLSTMSHELRTPLNGVIGLTNILSLQNPNEEQAETLSILRFSAENLMLLVNNVLDYSKLEAKMVELEYIPFKLSELMGNIIASVKQKSDEKKLYLKLEISDEARELNLIGDPTRLTQVLLNLLNNSIKFTTKGYIKLTCRTNSLDEHEANVYFEVEDTGIGIDKPLQSLIFEEFSQASAEINRKYGGTGLGLSIVRKILDLYKSKINIISDLGKGSKFLFEIKFKRDTSTKISQNIENKTPDKEDFRELKVLVVEDNEVNIIVALKTLKLVGIEADVAQNGKIALEMIETNTYDLILMDLYMPELDGYETTKLIRGMTDIQKSITPIIAVTAEVNILVIDELKKVGMNGYISKPFALKEMFDILKKYTKK